LIKFVKVISLNFWSQETGVRSKVDYLVPVTDPLHFILLERIQMAKVFYRLLSPDSCLL